MDRTSSLTSQPPNQNTTCNHTVTSRSHLGPMQGEHNQENFENSGLQSLASQGNRPFPQSPYLNPGAFVLREGVKHYRQLSTDHTSLHHSSRMDEEYMDTLPSGDETALATSECSTVESEIVVRSSGSNVDSPFSSGHHRTVLDDSWHRRMSTEDGAVGFSSSCPQSPARDLNCEQRRRDSHCEARTSYSGDRAGERQRSSSARPRQSSDRDNGRDFGRGWWKQASSNPSSNRSQSQNQTKRRNDSLGHRNTTGKKVRNDDGRSFGEGWWKGRIKQKAKEEERKNNGRSRLDKHSSNNPTTDLVPYTTRSTPALVTQFMEQVIYMKQEVADEEEFHGRHIHMDLAAVPGLWKASLGGSSCSLLVKIHTVPRKKSSSSESVITVMDIKGHTATVKLSFLSHGLPTQCEPGKFVFLRSVHWRNDTCGRVFIDMDDKENVMFSV